MWKVLSKFVAWRMQSEPIVVFGNPPWGLRYHGWSLWPFTCYVHHWLATDTGPPHDHGSFNLSIVIEGSATEQRYNRLFGGKWTHTRIRKGDIIFRTPWVAHKLKLPPGREMKTIYLFHTPFYEYRYFYDGKWYKYAQLPEMHEPKHGTEDRQPTL